MAEYKILKKDRYLCGIEVEKEDEEYIQNTSHLVQDGWSVGDDCSLDDDIGFEARSPIMPLSLNNRGWLVKYLAKYADLLSADCSENCGGHIHVSDSDRGMQALFEDMFRYTPLLCALYPDRVGRHYAKPALAVFGCDCSYCGSALMTNNGFGTVEIRIFDAFYSTGDTIFKLDIARIMVLEPVEDYVSILAKLLDKESNLYKTVEAGLKYTVVDDMEDVIDQFIYYSDSIFLEKLSRKQAKLLQEKK